MIAGLLAPKSINGWDESYFLFLIILFGSAFSLYPPKTGGLKMFGNGVVWPGLVGCVILMGALLLE